MSQPATSLLSYYGQSSGPEGLGIKMPVSPEELEFFAQQELVTIVPNFSLDSGAAEGRLLCIGGTYGPFQPNMPTDVPLWMALMLRKRKKCRIQPPAWMSVENLKDMFNQEKELPLFQPLPFYYIELAVSLFRVDPTDTFGAERFGEVRQLIEDIRQVRLNKIKTGLRKVGQGEQVLRGRTVVKLNNLAAGECNMIRLLLKGTLDHLYELTKSNDAWWEESLANGTQEETPFA